MRALKGLFIASLLLLLAAGPAMAMAEKLHLEVTNNTSKSITVNLDVDDGSGSGEATIQSSGTHTFTFYNTLWYAKKVKHNNKITLFYDGKLAKTYIFKVKNELTVMGQVLVRKKRLYQTSSPMECSVTLSIDAPVIWTELWGHMTVNSCN
jgi:hypothetical protein